MKALFISYNQALTDRIMGILNRNNVRGYTKWALTEGRGSVDGEPHLGDHTWPSMNSSLMAIVADEKIPILMDALRQLDETTRMQGLRAFVWNVEDQL